MGDAEVSSMFDRITTVILGGVVTLAAAMLIAGITIIVAPRPAEATPQSAAQTGKACGVCHQNAAGGGKLKPAGEKFKQDRKK